MENTNSNIDCSIYVLDVGQLPDIACDQLYAALPSARRERADAIRQPVERALSIGAAALLYAVLDRPLPLGSTLVRSRAEDVTADRVSAAMKKWELDWTPDDYGRPFPHAIPIPGKDRRLYVSLSHSGQWAAAALSCRPLGMDIQQDSGLSEASMQQIARRFHPDEQEVLNRLEGPALRDTFFRWWSMKESVMKLTGRGFRLPLNSFPIKESGPDKYETHWNGWRILLSSTCCTGLWIACAQWENGNTPACCEA